MPKPDPVKWANKLMDSLSAIDTHTAKAALNIAVTLNEYRAAWETSEALAQVQEEFASTQRMT
jgi:hypothetical protein